MNRTLVLLLAAAALAAGAAASAAGTSASRPALKLVQRTPLQVQGVHFKLRERVRVTASTDEDTAVRVVRTTRRGTFTVDLGSWDHCKSITVKAVGTRGDRATLVIQPPPPVDVPCWGL